MFCPMCSGLMKNKSYNYYGISDWDMDYPASYHEEFSCSKCNIKYLDGHWIIPNNLKPSYKQLKTGLFINRWLNIELPPPIKTLYQSFIRNYLKSAIIAKETHINQL